MLKSIKKFFRKLYIKILFMFPAPNADENGNPKRKGGEKCN